MNSFKYTRFFMPFFLCFLLVWLTLNSLTEVERVAELKKQGKAGEVLSAKTEAPSPSPEVKKEEFKLILGTTKPTPQPSSSSSQRGQTSNTTTSPENTSSTPILAPATPNPTPVSIAAPTPEPHLPPKVDEPTFCIQVITHACLMDESGQVSECRDFPTPCNVPPNWQIQQPNVAF